MDLRGRLGEHVNVRLKILQHRLGRRFFTGLGRERGAAGLVLDLVRRGRDDPARWGLFATIGPMVETIEITPAVGPIHARVRPPGSKSITNRALVCAALA